MPQPDEPLEPTRRMPRAQDPAAVPPPGYARGTPEPPAEQPPVVNWRPFLGGTLATAAVAALVGYVGAVVLESVFSINVIAPPNPFRADTEAGAFAAAGALLTALAAGVLVLLAILAPRPRLFFGWLMFLTVALTAALPFAWTDDTITAAFTSALNLLIGTAVWSLLSGTAARTIQVRTA